MEAVYFSDHRTHRVFASQRLAGYLDPGQAVLSAQTLLEELEMARPEDGRRRLALAASLLRQAVAMNPYEPGLASFVEQLAPHEPPGPDFAAWFAVLRRAVEAETQQDFDSARAMVERAAGPGDTPEGRARLAALASVQGEGGAPVLARFMAVMDLWRVGADLAEVVPAFCSASAGKAAAPLLAWALYRQGRAEAARQLAEDAPKNFFSLNLLAEMALAAGRKAEAKGLWRRSLDWEPGQPHLAMRLAQVGDDAPGPESLADRALHVAFYTYNKLEVTLQTLDSLMASHIGPAKVTLLNNGSTAFTPGELRQGTETVLARHGRRLGQGVDLVELPVNIGAPAARNWLWSLPASQEAEFVAYLDDDVFLPPDWLPRYVAALDADPDLCVVGPKGVNPGALPTIQYVYRYFQEVGDGHIRFTSNAPLIMDLGQFDYARPCLSVMGCCHCFHRPRVEALGVPGFDVRFTPSQVDDLEHDIQVWKRGGAALYDGRVTVVHRQDAGRAATMSEAAWGHVWGNHRKMEYKHPVLDLERVNGLTTGADLAAWRAALWAVADELPPGSRALWT